MGLVNKYFNAKFENSTWKKHKAAMDGIEYIAKSCNCSMQCVCVCVSMETTSRLDEIWP